MKNKLISVADKGKYYQMLPEEINNLGQFLIELKSILTEDRFTIFKELIEHLAEIQDPYNKEFPFIDNIIHGIEVARMAILKKPDASEVLILSALGHDWDRACGERRIKSADYPNTKDGNNQYKKEHAKNSADFFTKELKGRFSEDIISQVYEMILKHEIGGDGELGVLDFADGMVFFSPQVSGYYRLGRIYKTKDGSKLTGEELEIERKKGMATKIKFMSETMAETDKLSLIKYISNNADKYDPVVLKEILELLNFV